MASARQSLLAMSSFAAVTVPTIGNGLLFTEVLEARGTAATARTAMYSIPSESFYDILTCLLVAHGVFASRQRQIYIFVGCSRC